MNAPLTLIALLLAGSGGLFFFRVRSPAGAALTLPKMLVSQGASFVTAAGTVLALLGLTTGAFLAIAPAALAAALALRYLIRVAAPHDGFERAFGPDWRCRISPEQGRFMLKRRWVGRLPDRPVPRWERDVPYWRIPDSNRALLCDLWQPPAGMPTSGLALLYFHGSGWHWLDKDFNTRRFFRHLCTQGHVVMDVAYRLCPEVDLHGMLGDVKRAIAWMKTQARQYGVDPQRVVLGGGSAGGHLALLAAYAPNHPELTPDDVKGADLSVAGVVSYYGPVDMRAYYDHARAVVAEPRVGKAQKPSGVVSRLSDGLARLIMGELFERIKGQDFGIGHRRMMTNLLGGQPDDVPQHYEQASPIFHAGLGSPPTLLLQGGHDSLVPASACRGLHQKLVQAKVPVVYVEYPQTEHAFDVAILTRYSPAAQAALYELERFLALL